MDNIMNVGELKKMLGQYPDDMRVIMDKYSDYHDINIGAWSVIKGVDKQNYIMRSHPTMNAANKAEEVEFLHLLGN